MIHQFPIKKRRFAASLFEVTREDVGTPEPDAVPYNGRRDDEDAVPYNGRRDVEDAVPYRSRGRFLFF